MRTQRMMGLMMDAARQPESIATCKQLLDFGAEWGFNTVLFRVADDCGLAVKLENHPELYCHHDAFTKAEIKQIVAYAGERGIDVIPEVESFGHTRFITSVKEYAALSDAEDGVKSEFNGLCPVNRMTLSLLEGIYAEVASLFPSRYFHGGCDEVHWGGSKLSKEVLQSRSRTQVWADYINALHEIARKLKKEFIVWGDHVLRKESDLLDRIDKKVIIMDWDYWTTDPVLISKYAAKAVQKGFRIIGGPALGWCKWGPRAGASQLRNIDSYAGSYSRINDKDCLGVILTHWCPWRFVANSYFDGFAYAAVSILEGPQAARELGFKKFVEKHYAAEWSGAWADVFSRVYQVESRRIPWHDGITLTTALEENHVVDPGFARIEAGLVVCEQSVRRNPDDFNAFKLSVQYLRHLSWRTSVLLDELKKEPNAPRAGLLIKAIAERDRFFASALFADWKKTRPPNSRTNSEATMGGHAEQDRIVFMMKKAAAYTQALAEDASASAGILEAIGKAKNNAAVKPAAQSGGAAC